MLKAANARVSVREAARVCVRERVAVRVCVRPRVVRVRACALALVRARARVSVLTFGEAARIDETIEELAACSRTRCAALCTNAVVSNPGIQTHPGNRAVQKRVSRGHSTANTKATIN
uniref:Uncharacterized protein n=1 Tax=Chrysotila carterae TaxID=13221 RepID=A0A7S4F6D5_CHRCT